MLFYLTVLVAFECVLYRKAGIEPLMLQFAILAILFSLAFVLRFCWLIFKLVRLGYKNSADRGSID